jgi:RNA polymerase sigma factor (sigma-70 family)
MVELADGQAFRDLTDPYRRELQLHCYRILGSVQDAEDILQETLLAAWRGLAGFEERSSLRAWLYRIATNRCLNALRAAGRRPPPAPVPPFTPPAPTAWGEVTHLQPYPDALLDGIVDTAPGPEARYESRETVELAFVAGLQHLPPRQRAALVLRDVLGYPTSEVAAMLGDSPASVKAALQRARAALAQHRPPADAIDDGDPAPSPGARGGREGTSGGGGVSGRGSDRDRELARRFAEAFEADDIDGVVALLTGDAWLAMPPAPHRYQGAVAIAGFLRTSEAWRAGRRFRLVPTGANTQPAFGCYLEDRIGAAAQGTGLIVLTVAGDRIAAVTRFLDADLLPRFGLPEALRPEDRRPRR